MAIKAIAGYTISVISDGAPGAPGAPGATGATGATIKSAVEQFRLSTSETELAGNYQWSEKEPDTIPDGCYLWGRNKFTMTDGKTVYSNAVHRSTIEGIKNEVDSVNKKITDKIWSTDIESQIDAYDETTTSKIRDRVSSTEQDLDGIMSHVLDISTTVVDGQKTYTSQKLSTMEQNVETFKTTVSKTYATMSYADQSEADAKSYADKLNSAMDGRMDTAESTIAQNADSIALMVSVNGEDSSITLTDKMVTAMTSQFVVKDPKGSATIISGGKIHANSITTTMLAADAIKSQNYAPVKNANGTVDTTSPYSAAGTYLDLTNGNFYTPNFGVQGTGGAFINGDVFATSGQFGQADIGSYWKVETIYDYNSQPHAALYGVGDPYIQSGYWQLSDNKINTQSYVTNAQSSGKLQYFRDEATNTFYDVGMKIPTNFSGYSKNDSSDVRFQKVFYYGRKYTGKNTPTFDSDWTYFFEVDTDGNIYENGVRLSEKYASIDGVSGDYLPRKGGTIDGDLTVKGTLTATASSAKTLSTGRNIQVNLASTSATSFDGSKDIFVGISGTLDAAHGGTGQTSAKNAANAFMNALDTGSSTPVDADYYISQYVAGGTKTTTYHRRPMSALWNYIKGKIDSVYDITGNYRTLDNNIFDTIQVTDLNAGNIIVTGAGRFTNGLYGDLTGDVSGTATYATKVKDSGDGKDITFSYSKSGLTSPSWLAAWNGYELRAISPANMLSTIGAMSANKKFTYGELVPIATKTYTDVIATANNQDNGALYFIKVLPTSYTDSWSIKYKVSATIENVSAGNGSGFEESIVEIYGMRNTYSGYRIWNNISNTSYRPYYYHCFYRAKEAGITGGYGHALGIHLRYSYNPTTTSNARTVNVEILETDKCTVTLLDHPVEYSEWTGTGSTNYETYNNFDGTTNGVTTTGDRNDANYYNRNYYGNRTAYAALYRYQLCLTRPDRSILPINSVNNSIETDKTLTTESFDPFGDIMYWSSTSTYSAGANVGDGWYSQYLADLRYSFNIGGNNTQSTLVGREPLYLVASPQPGGTAKLHSEPLAQALPTSDDGLIYIYLGQVHPDTHPYRVYLTLLHPIYWYKNGAVRQYLPQADTAVKDSSGNTIASTYLKKTGDTMSGNLTLGTTSSGDSPAIIFQRGTLTDSYNDWRIQDVYGYLYFGQRGSGSSDFDSKIYLDASGGVHATTFNGSLSGNASTATTAGSLTTGRDFTIGKTKKSAVKWDGNVTFTQEEISDCASNTANGWMSKEDKEKLDQITVSDIGTVGANSIKGASNGGINVTISNGIATLKHTNQLSAGGTAQGTANNTNLTNGGSFTVPTITYDINGHIKSTGTNKLVLPNITSITGNAATATKFASAQSVTLTGDTTGTASSQAGWSIATQTKHLSSSGRATSLNLRLADMLGKIQYNLAASQTTEGKPSKDGHVLTFAWDNNGLGAQLSIQDGKNNHLEIRGANNNSSESDWEDWKMVLDSTNYNTYSPKLDGTGATGTWGIDISGNAATATKADSVAWEDVSDKPIIFAAAKSSSATDKWKALGGRSSGEKITISYNGNKASWNSAQYSSSLLFGCNDTKGLLDISHSTPCVSFAGGSVNNSTDADPKWYFKLTGTTATTYNLDGYLKLSGGEMTGPIKWNSNSLVQSTGFDYLVGIDAFASGGQMKWSRVGDITVGTATKAKQDSDGNAINTTYAKLSGADFTGVVKSQKGICANSAGSGTLGGISLYESATTTAIENYGIAMRFTSNSGKHGYVQGDWAIYSYMSGTSSNVAGRGWILRNTLSDTGVASVNTEGHAVFNGSITVGGNAANTSGMRMEYDTTLQCTNFIFN